MDDASVSGLVTLFYRTLSIIGTISLAELLFRVLSIVMFEIRIVLTRSFEVIVWGGDVIYSGFHEGY